MTRRRAAVGAALALAGSAALAVPIVSSAQGDAPPTAAPPAALPSPGGPAAGDPRPGGLAAAAAWADALGARRSPRVPDPGPTERLIVLLDGPGAAWAPPAGRAAAAAAAGRAQSALEPSLGALGATVTQRWRVVLNGVAVDAPAGRADAIATLDGVREVVPVSYLAPAAVDAGPAGAAGGAAADALPGAVAPAHVALIDTAVDPRAPQLGGGVGPTFPIIGGLDLVEGDSDPTVGDGAPAWEAHGTQMAGLVLGSPALGGLPPQRVPRLLAHRVVAPEQVDGRRLPLARTDRVLTALERAVDPDGDGDTADGAEVVLIGLAGGFAGGGGTPLGLATEGATRAGSLVVAPAGNDGPTFAGLGSVGSPASGGRVLTVGGLSDPLGPRLAAVRLRLGPAGADLRDLPLLGPDPPRASAPVVALPGPDGPGPGDEPREYARGVDVRGAVVLVSRGGGTLQQKAAAAAAAGAVALVVWDRAGTGVFPGGAADGGPVIPVLGAAADQGRALAELLARQGPVTGEATAQARRAEPETVASFSSTGPTADGRVKPDLIAPAVGVAAPWPPGPDGTARTAAMTGTSAAAAVAAGVALRLRADRPDLGPDAVRAMLVGAAEPLPGVRVVAQGGGRITAPASSSALVIRPPILTAPAGPRAPVVTGTVEDLAGAGARLRVVVQTTGRVPLRVGPVLTVPPGGRAALRVALPRRPRGWSGRVALVAVPSGRVVAGAPAATFPPRRPRRDDLGRPLVSVSGGVARAVVRIGRLARVGDRVRSAPLHDVRLLLAPADGSEPVLAAGVASTADWAAGTYRFVLSRRLPTGGTLPAGRYRLQVRARPAQGPELTEVSAPFTLR
jgi:hypothetical protein